MSTLPGNPHAEAALDALLFSADDSPTQATEGLLAGLKDAILALAYEQRTATLAALWCDPEDDDMGLYGVNYGTLADQVKNRLGLNGDKS